MSRSFRMRLKEALLTVVASVLFSLLLFFNDAFIRTAPDLQQIGNYDTTQNLVTYVLGGLIGGTVFSIFEFFVLANFFRRFGLLLQVLIRGSLLMLLYIGLTVLMSVLYNVQTTGKGPLDPEVLAGVREYFSGPVVIINLVFYFIFFISIIFAHQMTSLVGRGITGKFLFARFKKPRIVERVFMFMDLNSSTTIAERIGPTQFFALIQDFMTDAGAEILEHGGEINKYVGDEIIIVWSVERGARNAAALRCVQAVHARLASRREYYEKRYGLVPEFKSGIHVGPAMVGELGDWKREIAYMGDVLNTTARIQGACKKLGAGVLVSEAYYEYLSEADRQGLRHAGRGRLRGKDELIRLYGIMQAASAGSVSERRDRSAR